MGDEGGNNTVNNDEVDSDYSYGVVEEVLADATPYALWVYGVRFFHFGGHPDGNTTPSDNGINPRDHGRSVEKLSFATTSVESSFSGLRKPRGTR